MLRLRATYFQSLYAFFILTGGTELSSKILSLHFNEYQKIRTKNPSSFGNIFHGRIFVIDGSDGKNYLSSPEVSEGSIAQVCPIKRDWSWRLSAFRLMHQFKNFYRQQMTLTFWSVDSKWHFWLVTLPLRRLFFNWTFWRQIEGEETWFGLDFIMKVDWMRSRERLL